MEEHALECAFCFLTFDGFKELAEHTQLAHVPESERKDEYSETNRAFAHFRESGETACAGRRRL